MKIIVVSDNHGKSEPLADILMMHPDAYVFLHCGDSELPLDYMKGYMSVIGNNDFYLELPEYRIISVGSHKIFMTHGHRYIFLDNRDLLVEKARSQGCDIVCFGHTHVFETFEMNGVHVCNPGSLSRNRDGSNPCYAIITINEEQVDIERKDYYFGCKI